MKAKQQAKVGGRKIHPWKVIGFANDATLPKRKHDAPHIPWSLVDIQWLSEQSHLDNETYLDQKSRPELESLIEKRDLVIR